MPGRPAKPIAMHKLTGSFRADRHGEAPETDGNRPIAPDFLDDNALVEWNRIVDHLVKTGVAGSMDMGCLAGHCQAWSDYIEAVLILRKEGRTVTSQSGYSQPHPMVAIMNSSWDRYLKTAREMGLTPAARTKIDVGTTNTTTSGRSKYIGNG